MRKKSGTGKKFVSARTKLGKRERKRLIQLILCICLFLVVFIGKGHSSEEISETGVSILQLIREDTDFKQLFHMIGENVKSERPMLEKLGQLITGGLNREEEMRVKGQKGPAVQMAQLSLRQEPTRETLLTAIGRTPNEDALPKTEPEQEEISPSPEVTPTPEVTPPPAETPQPSQDEQASQEIPQYTGPALPAGATMDYYELGLSETVTPVVGRLTSPYGYRDHPISGEYIFHAGVDISANIGTPVQAFSGGTVDFVGQSDAYGLYIQIDHGNGITTFYCHCSELCAQKGEQITTGQVVAKTGDTGNTTGPHLHMEMKKDGVLINPAYYIEIVQA